VIGGIHAEQAPCHHHCLWFAAAPLFEAMQWANPASAMGLTEQEALSQGV